MNRLFKALLELQSPTASLGTSFPLTLIDGLLNKLSSSLLLPQVLGALIYSLAFKRYGHEEALKIDRLL